MIVDTSNINNFLPSVNFKVSSDRFNDYLILAQSDVVEKIIGERLELDIENGEVDDKKLIIHISRAIATAAYLDAIPEFDVQLSEAGFVVASNEAVKPASRERVDKLLQAMSSRKSAAYDNLVSYLLANSVAGAQYERWRKTKQFKNLCRTPVLTVGDFLNHSLQPTVESRKMLWDTFYLIIPVMERVLRGLVASYVSKEFVSELLAKIQGAETLTSVETDVLTLVKQAVVAGALDNMDVARKMAIVARNTMLDNIDSFASFRNSSVYTLPSLNIAGEGGIANFL